MHWITDDHIILKDPHVEGLLPPTDTESTPFQNPASKVTGLQVHATSPGLQNYIAKAITNTIISMIIHLRLYHNQL